MVSAYRTDSLRNPTASLQEFYDESNGATADKFPRLVSEHYANVFRAPDAFQEIPTLDVRNPPDAFPNRSLVRFRAMVQDTSPSSEMYLSKSKSGKCGGWGIDFVEEEDGLIDYADLRECVVLWAVSVPTESTWCSEELNGAHGNQDKSSPSGSKLQYKPQYLHKFPLGTPHVGVQVKIYDTEGSERLKSTDVVTFVGILTTESSVSLSYSPDDLLTARTSSSSLSTSLDATAEVPTLHVLYIQQHPYSLLSRPYPYKLAQEHKGQNAIADPAQIRTELISWVAEEALGGDHEAAEWVLLACIARVQSRNPPLLPPSLTLTQFPPPPPTPSTSATAHAPIPALSAVLAELLPLMHTLPLSLDTLNRDRFTPESKEEDLHSGVLQLPQGTVLLITEGGLKEGKLVERGILNVHALQDVMATQTLAYTFPFSQFSFPTDISCVVLSEGSKSAFFKTDISVALNAVEDNTSIAKLYKSAENVALPPPDKLAAFRDFLIGARHGKVQVTEETSEHIQRDFVRERQHDKSITSDDLIRRMTVAKLYALSLHDTNLTVDIWERAKAFDERRRKSAVRENGLKHVN